jgi:hypothetical protein
MRQIVENQARSSMRLLEYAYFRNESDEMRIEEALTQQSLRLLFEQAQGLDDEETVAALQRTQQILTDLIEILEKEDVDVENDSISKKLPNALRKLLEEIPDQSAISGAIIEDDPDEIKQVAAKAAISTREALEAAATIQAAMNKVSTELGKFNPTDKTQTLAMLTKYPEKYGKFVTDKQLRAGLTKAFEPPGWFAKKWSDGAKSIGAGEGVIGFLKKIFSKSEEPAITPGLFADSISYMTYSHFISAASAIRGIEIEKRVEGVGETTTDDMQDAADTNVSSADNAAGEPDDTGQLTAAQETKADAQGVALAKQLGPGPIGKEDWDKIVKLAPDLFARIGKKGLGPKRAGQGKKFRAAINAKAKKDVFDVFEGRLLTSTRKDNDTGEDDETFNRWKELAGIKS